MDNLIYHMLRAWARRRHPNKNRHWIVSKYWLVNVGGGWSFTSRSNQHLLSLFRHAQTPINRHVKVQGKRSPYDGDWLYWSQRMGYHPTVTSTVAKLLKKQAGRCNHCGLYFFANDRMEVHHVDKDPTNFRRSNLALLHRHCHDQVHAMYV